MASVQGERVCVLVWHYHDDDVAGADAEVELTVEGLTGEIAGARHFRVDETHSNAFTAWKGMGSPKEPTAEQYAALEKAGRLAAPEASEVRVVDGTGTMRFTLPRRGVALLVLE